MKKKRAKVPPKKVAKKVRKKLKKKAAKKSKPKRKPKAKKAAAKSLAKRGALVSKNGRVVTARDAGFWTPQRQEIIKRMCAKEATEDEFFVFMHTAKMLGANPLAKQIYCIHRKNSSTGRKDMSIQVSIDMLRLIAERSGKHMGRTAPQWCGEDGKWLDVWPDAGVVPMACKIGVHKLGPNGDVVTTWAVVHYREFADRTGFMWGVGKMPCNQIAKCCEAQGLRAAHPQELSGVYAHEEMPKTEVVTEEADDKVAKQYDGEITKACRRFYTAANDAGFKGKKGKAAIMKGLKKKYGVTSASDLSLKELKEATKALEDMPLEPAAAPPKKLPEAKGSAFDSDDPAAVPKARVQRDAEAEKAAKEEGGGDAQA